MSVKGDRSRVSDHDAYRDNFGAIEWNPWGCYDLSGKLVGKGKTFDEAQAIGDKMDDGLSYHVRKV